MIAFFAFLVALFGFSNADVIKSANPHCLVNNINVCHSKNVDSAAVRASTVGHKKADHPKPDHGKKHHDHKGDGKHNGRGHGKPDKD